MTVSSGRLQREPDWGWIHSGIPFARQQTWTLSSGSYGSFTRSGHIRHNGAPETRVTRVHASKVVGGFPPFCENMVPPASYCRVRSRSLSRQRPGTSRAKPAGSLPFPSFFTPRQQCTLLPEEVIPPLAGHPTHVGSFFLFFGCRGALGPFKPIGLFSLVWAGFR